MNELFVVYEDPVVDHDGVCSDQVDGMVQPHVHDEPPSAFDDKENHQLESALPAAQPVRRALLGPSPRAAPPVVSSTRCGKGRRPFEDVTAMFVMPSKVDESTDKLADSLATLTLKQVRLL